MTVIPMLALGIGATTAMYSLIHQVILEPMPVPGRRRARELQIAGAKVRHARAAISPSAATAAAFSYPMYRDLGAEQRVFSGSPGTTRSSRTSDRRGHDALASAVLVSGNYFTY